MRRRKRPRLNEFEPDVIHAYGSYLEALFGYLSAARAPFHRPKVITYSSDGLADSVRRLITETFGIPVLGTYQAVEAFKIAFECGSGLHVNADLYPVRIVDSDGRAVPAGETGEVVVSNLVNRATVLLNYRLGDLAAMTADPCPCGRALPRLTVSTAGATSGSTCRPAARCTRWSCAACSRTSTRSGNTRSSRKSPARFRVLVVAAEACDRAATRDRLRGAFSAQLGAEVQVDVAFCDAIPRPPGGKPRVVVSLRAGRAVATGGGPDA